MPVHTTYSYEYIESQVAEPEFAQVHLSVFESGTLRLVGQTWIIVADVEQGYRYVALFNEWARGSGTVAALFVRLQVRALRTNRSRAAVIQYLCFII